MTELVKINDETIDTTSLIKHLKLTGQYDTLIEEMVRERLTVQASERAGVDISEQSVQERADQIRRVRGLHRALDMNRWLDQLKISLDEFEKFIVDSLRVEQQHSELTAAAAVEAYFASHSPKFDSVMVSHIIVDSDGKAREIIALLEDVPEMFGDLAREHSLADTATEGGYIGTVLRGSLASDIEARIFNAEEGAVLGPFASGDGQALEIFMVDAKRTAALDEHTGDEIRRILKEDWLKIRAKESRIELLG
ncbi:MAG: peptidylprolyl isomerase [Pseudomonadales bacterium]